MGRLSRIAALAGIAALVAAPGCGGGSGSDGTRSQARPDATATTTAPAASHQREAPNQTVAPSHCPPGHPSCRSTEGRIVYVERVDPDGDGDAHFVLADPQGITLPGLTAIDVRRGLRPHPLPGPGDLISAAGPVQTGSYGQHQIHALELHVAGG
jgi:hypothetical protein